MKLKKKRKKETLLFCADHKDVNQIQKIKHFIELLTPYIASHERSLSHTSRRSHSRGEWLPLDHGNDMFHI